MTEALAELTELSSWFLLPASILYILAIGEGKKAIRWFMAGLGVHFLNILYRGFKLGWIPLAERHDTISFLAFSIALIAFNAYRSERDESVLVAASPATVIFLVIAFMTRRLDDIGPFLNTPWFFLHAATYFLSFGFLAVGSIFGVLFLSRGPEHYEQVQYRMLAHGWIFYTISLVLGSIWFFVAYGTYWLWTAKELWSTITWFYLGMYLHFRFLKGFRGKPAAALGVLAVGFALFTYFGVGTIIPAPPTPF